MNMEKIYIIELKHTCNNSITRDILSTSYSSDKAYIQFMSYILWKLSTIKDIKLKEYTGTKCIIDCGTYEDTYTLYEFDIN